MRLRVHLILICILIGLAACVSAPRSGPRGGGHPAPRTSDAPAPKSGMPGDVGPRPSFPDDGLIGPGKVASIRYRLTDDRGELVDETPRGEALTYLCGTGFLLPGIEGALKGRRAGETLEVEFGPGEVFGDFPPPAGHDLVERSLKLDAEILAVRAATPEEIEHRHPHGHGGTGH